MITDAVRILIASGADVNVKTLDRETPLFVASAQGYHQIVTMLIEAGATRSAGWLGIDPIEAAIELQHISVTNIFRAYESEVQ